MLRKLNEWYMGDPEVVNVAHCSLIIETGIKHRVYDCDYLKAIVDLIKAHGVTIAVGQEMLRAIPYFISSVEGNLAGRNAAGKVPRDQNICASLELLTELASSVQS